MGGKHEAGEELQRKTRGWFVYAAESHRPAATARNSGINRHIQWCVYSMENRVFNVVLAQNEKNGVECD